MGEIATQWGYEGINEFQTAFDGRSIIDTCVKFIAIRAATVIAVGHLTTLRSEPPQVQKYRVGCFALLPTLPLGSVLLRGLRSMQHCWKYSIRRPERENRGDLVYYTSATLGIWAVESAVSGQDSDVSWPLLGARFDALRRIPEKRDLRWFARLLVLVVFLIQDGSVVFLCCRRWARGSPWMAAFDWWNLLYALGGAVTCVESLLLSLCNWTWQLDRPLPPRVQRALEADEPSFGNWSGISLRSRPSPDSLIEIGIAQAIMQGLLFPAMVVLYRKPDIMIRDVVSMHGGMMNGAFKFRNWPLITMDVLFICFWYVPATGILGPLLVFSLWYTNMISDSRAKVLISLVLRVSVFMAWVFLSTLTVIDFWMLAACGWGEVGQKGKTCPPQPVQWKDPWADRLWAF